MGNSQQPCCKLSGEGECVCPHSVALHDFVWTTRVHWYKTVTVIMVIFLPTSSLAMVMLSWTSPNTVGWMKYPLSAAIPPPHISLAPSLFPLLMYPRILLNCSWSIWRVYWKKEHRLYVTVQSTRLWEQHRLYVYLRSLLCLKVKRISYNSFLGSLHTALHKLVVDISLDIRSRASTATLALVEKQSKVGLLHSVLHWIREETEKLSLETILKQKQHYDS